MAGRIAKLRKLIKGGAHVQESATLARAMAAMMGKKPLQELVGASQLSRAVLTAKQIEQYGSVPWPRGLTRQLDPEDPAFLPPLNAQLSIFSREFTRLGHPGKPEQALVDPWGWCGVRNQPMVTLWWSDSNGAHCMGELPVSQRRSDENNGIVTSTETADVSLEIFHWPIVIAEQSAWAKVVRVRALKSCSIRLAFVIQAKCLDGAQPIFSLRRSLDAEWSADGRPILALHQAGQSVLTAAHSTPSLWKQFAADEAVVSSPIEQNCGFGWAEGAEILTLDLTAGEEQLCFAVLSPPVGVASRIVRTSARSLWAGSAADFRGIGASGAGVDIGAHQSLLQQVEHRLLLTHLSAISNALTGAMVTVALARLGFVNQAGVLLSQMLNRTTNGNESQVDRALMAWAAAEYVLWTRERTWLQRHQRQIIDLLDSVLGVSEAGGHMLFGNAGSVRWTEIWRAAALLNGVRIFRQSGMDCARWGLAGATMRETLLEKLGPAPWSADKFRAPDGSSAALLAAVWVGLIPCDHPAVLKTEKFLLEEQNHAGGVLLQGGAHIAATGMLLAMQKRAEPEREIISTIAHFASSTGALPTVFHQRRGALGDGDDALSAAIFALLVLDEIQVEKGKIRLGGGIRYARDLPTPYGDLSIVNGKIINRVPAQIVESSRA